MESLQIIIENAAITTSVERKLNQKAYSRGFAHILFRER